MADALTWRSSGEGEPDQAVAGDLTIYRFEDGSASVAVANVWVSAMFVSPEAVLSWDGRWREAEEEWRLLNPAGGGPNLLGIRQAEPKPPVH